ncbi:GNAT family N-acetyltransferase [Cereibacter sphaeroides]|uniref:GNAT family N-acetyltransferase n=1 Tax=Cereibacter sphaeroides TaxID=1063 RepID=UPI001F383CEC|nr:GNAT family N-acyltransferase [Cereibacter sphaeroides]MCE6949580.1 GNAT family N-acetyltransferase [Cereibacter sphaeroides]
MIAEDPHLELRLAASDRDLRAAQRLRYRIFVEELGGNGDLVDHSARLERDEFDAHCDHLLLIDRRRSAEALDDVVGVYRLMPGDRAERLGRFYCDTEYDLDPLRRSGRRLLELGRSCVHEEYRGGSAVFLLWSGLADYVLSHGTELLFGVASFHGIDTEALAEPLACLHHNHLAPAELRVRVRPECGVRMDLIPADRIDRRAAMLAMPPLIKAYLRLGGFVGEGAWIDRAFNTTDVCLVMDTARMSARHRELYTRRQVAVE